MNQTLRLLKLDLVAPAERVRDRPERHRHDWHELVVVRSGRYGVQLGGERLEGDAGTAFVYPAGTSHDPDHFELGETLLWVLQWQGGPDPGRARAVVDPDARLLLALEWMTERQECGPQGDTVVAGLLAAVVTELAAPTGSSRLPDPVRRVQHYLRLRLAEPIALDDLVIVAHCSRQHLIRQFRRHLQTTPMRELRRLRAEAARRLLRSTDLPTATIAKRVGLAGRPQLARLLIATLGQGPAAIRAAGSQALDLPPGP